MEFRNIFGLNNSNNKIDWRSPISLFLALMLSSVLQFILGFFGDEVQQSIVPGLVYNLLFIGFSILIIHFLKFKSDLVNILLISLFCGLLSSGFDNLFNDRVGCVHYLSNILSAFVMIYVWLLLIKRLKNRKLVLVIGYLAASILSAIFMIYTLSNNPYEVPITKMIVNFSITHVFWTFEFWIGLLIFDKVLGVKTVKIKS